MSTPILEGYSSQEKKAYIIAIASIATADQSASDQEMNYLANLANASGLSEEEKNEMVYAAKETSGQSLKPALDILKSSELKYSLITDLIAFAESDNNVAEQEKKHISSIANYLEISDEQVTLLNQYVKETANQPAEAMGISGAGGLGGILDNFGLGDKLKNSGINMGSLTKGLIGFIGPMIMGKMLNKGLQGTNASSSLGQGGLGSLLGGLSGGKGIGGLLSGFLK
jgi:uncharacterized tellurite resistance protein B-like protein